MTATGRLLAAALAAAVGTAGSPSSNVSASFRSSCHAALQTLCGSARSTSVFACAECAGSHTQHLQAAGCSNDAISAWCAGQTTGIGSVLERAYTSYVHQPTAASDATSNGWKPLTLNGAQAPCSPDIGVPWTIGGVRSHKTPVALHFSAAGQIIAITVDVCCGDSAIDPDSGPWFVAMHQAGYLTAGASPSEPFTFTVSLRNTSATTNLCDPSVTFDELLGTRVAVLSSGTTPAFSGGGHAVTRLLPLTKTAAELEGYRRGACEQSVFSVERRGMLD